MSENEKMLPLYDVFPDNYFNCQDWHAPCLEEPDEIRQLLKQCRLESRTIKNIRLVGLDYAHTLEEDVPTPKDAPHPYCGLAEQMDPNQKEERCVEIDEPIIITFDNGEQLEIDTPLEGEYRISMNRLPRWITGGENLPNVDAALIFSPCIGATIVRTEVCIDAFYNHTPRVCSVVLHLDNGFGLLITTFVDYCLVYCVDANHRVQQFPFYQLQEALYNWEDLHWDKALGFAPQSQTIYIGEKGTRRVEDPFLKLYAAGKPQHRIYICAMEHALLLNWALTLTLGEFSIYDDYQLSYEQWATVLNYYRQLLACTDEQTLHAFMAAHPSKDNAYTLQTMGKAYFDRPQDYLEQFQDLERWTQLVLEKGDTMQIIGF